MKGSLAWLRFRPYRTLALTAGLGSAYNLQVVVDSLHVGSFMRGAEIVKIAEPYGWADHGPGAKHPYMLKRPGALRPIPVRDKLENRAEVQGILKQLEIPKGDWPEKVK